METKIHRPKGECALTGRPFAPGDPLVSALVRGPDGLARVDCHASSWRGPPEKCLAWWRSAFPRPESAAATLAPNDVLLDLLEQLDGNPDEAPLRYLLALQLLRRRVLRVVEASGSDVPPAAAEELRVACRKRDCQYQIAVAPPEASAAAAVEARLASLLWSGDAA